ncbi:hypothetical protein BDW62DRAFT_205920 [Aspergillus aurantiobrunneus]
MQLAVLAAFARELRIPVAQLDCSLSFTNHGGHSLAALRLVAACKRLGVSLSVGELLQNRPIKEILSRDARVEVPIPHDAGPIHTTKDILEDSFINIAIETTPPSPPATLTPRSLTPTTDIVSCNPDPDPDRVPIPEMQLSLIRGSYGKPGTNILAYRQPCHATDLPALKAAWRHVLEGEEIFSKSFHIEDGAGYLLDGECAATRWTDVVVSSLDDFQTQMMAAPRFTDIGSELRAIIVDGYDMACMLWHVHHVFLDGFSMEILVQKVGRVIAGLPVQPGPSFTTVIHQRKLLIKQREEEARRYWQSQKPKLDQASSELHLPCRDEADENVFWNGVASFIVHTPATQLAQYAQQHNVTVAAIYYAAWALVLSIVCDSDNVLLGAVMSGRSLPVAGILDVVGSLVNTLPIAISVEEGQSTISFLQTVFQQLVSLSGYDWSEPEHGYSRRFSSVLAMQFDTSNGTSFELKHHSPSARMNSEIPLSLTIEADGAIHIQHTRKYDKQNIEMIGTYFTRAIESLLNPHFSISMCLEDMLCLDDRQTLFINGNCLSGLTTKTSVHDNLASLMARAAMQTPTLCAAKIGDDTMNYEDLNRWSDCVANHLAMYVNCGDVVCVHALPSLYWLVAIYAIVKAGAVYCPLNPALDPELRRAMFESSGANIFLVPSVAHTKLRPKGSRYCWAVEDLLQRQDASGEEYVYNVSPEANAYLCFTSGSSGKPKGVLCTHQGLVAFQRDHEVRLLARPGTKVAQLMSVSFDGSIHEVFSALSYGATLVLPMAGDPFVHLHEVDTCILTPSLAATLDPADYPNLQAVYLVGEQVSQAVNDQWAEKTTLYNMYGPTEATCGATIKRLRPGQKVTIGHANPSTRIYILDRNRRLAPPGVVGQIFLAGVQVSNGYLHQPQLTAERFFADSVCRGLGEQMYATGDLGYWTKDGELVCLGRNDRQVKLRGFRVDLNDIEARIATLSGVTGAAVARIEDELVVMVQPASVCPVECKRRMMTVLPVHAIPRYVVPVAQFPMTGAGKLDYKAIGESVQHGCLDNFVPVMTGTGQQVARIWSDILGVNEAGLTGDSNFIAAGGNSLLQLRLASRLSATFSCSVPLTVVIGTHNLHDLAAKIDELRGCQCLEAVHAPTKKQQDPVSRMEAEWCSRYAAGGNTSAFNVSFVCRLGLSVDTQRLAASWNAVLAHHPVLRSRYRGYSTQARRIYSELSPNVRTESDCDIAAEINRPFIISEEQPIRVTITPRLMAITASHIICDLTTMQTLLNQVRTLYHGETTLPPSPTYITADAWNRVASPTDLLFWSTYLHDAPHPAKKRTTYTGSSRAIILPDLTAQAMSTLCQTSHFTQHQLSLAAVALALQPTSTALDLVLGGPFLNRWSESDMNTVGLFLEPIPFRIRFDPKNPATFLQQVQCSSQMALAHVVPWQELLCHLGITPEFPNESLFDVMVTFHPREHALRLGIEGVEEVYTWSQGAKFALMCEFTEIPDGRLLLRMEYDEEVWAMQEIYRVERAIVSALGLLVRNTPYAEMVAMLQEAECASTLERGEGLFGLPLRRA